MHKGRSYQKCKPQIIPPPPPHARLHTLRTDLDLCEWLSWPVLHTCNITWSALSLLGSGELSRSWAVFSALPGLR